MTTCLTMTETLDLAPSDLHSQSLSGASSQFYIFAELPRSTSCWWQLLTMTHVHHNFTPSPTNLHWLKSGCS